MRRPHFIAAQARHPTGLLGRLIATIMAKETRGDNFWSIETLEPKEGQHILDVGTGHGAALEELAKRIGHGLAAGIDPSEIMVGMAARRNEAAIRRGTVEVATASVDALPFPHGSFDGAMAVHVLYFWPDLVRPLAEIARVLKPGAKLVLLFRVSGDPRTASFPNSVYKFRSLDDVRTALDETGFTVEKVAGHLDGEKTTPAVVLARSRTW